ncbi:SHOCT domain-containing protein [Lichenifustis flavocetrariae]|uniref:SHOCT domain-containing protein n=1 Tax=Lichenifustis flavocetrariae TaxID=2949735 RepID=A0AA41YXD4_9HYPH|nr:SHOCT domain-containing protein [Lichenifustis flavocetrariae]MCW6509879.1 SHOCT domain-containing protein [Lichenifustis flavocetrariae]
MSVQPEQLAEAARRHGFSLAAAEALFGALVAGGGGQAQFSHPELGGMGQWSNGMTQIGDMFNDGLKARVNGFCQDMSAAARAARSTATGTNGGTGGAVGRHGSAHWWPSDLGSASSSGAQNGMRYACFPERRRLAIERDGQVTIYDTGHYRLTGFSQQQGSDYSLSFSGPDGPVSLDSLSVVGP